MGGNQEKFGNKVARFIEKKSLVVGGGAFVVALIAAEIAPSLVVPALKIALFEGLQWGGAKWYLDREKTTGGLKRSGTIVQFPKYERVTSVS